jgi:hypothetical protein
MSEQEKDIFDDLDVLKVQLPDRERALINTVVKPARVMRTEPFGMIKLSPAKRLGVTGVIVHLAYQMMMSGGKPVPATAERTGCENQYTRLQALRLLEREGVAEIEWRGNGAAPLVKRWDL